ncbi:MAG: hypothetical protein KC561_16080 [Myxococcales bacterium]|nr:hypothetical protein [Myxococcales bacterium]
MTKPWTHSLLVILVSLPLSVASAQTFTGEYEVTNVELPNGQVLDLADAQLGSMPSCVWYRLGFSFDNGTLTVVNQTLCQSEQDLTPVGKDCRLTYPATWDGDTLVVDVNIHSSSNVVAVAMDQGPTEDGGFTRQVRTAGTQCEMAMSPNSMTIVSLEPEGAEPSQATLIRLRSVVDQSIVSIQPARLDVDFGEQVRMLYEAAGNEETCTNCPLLH